jgi:hypothetical protein
MYATSPFEFYFANVSDLPVTSVVFVVTTPKCMSECLAVPYIAPRTHQDENGHVNDAFNQRLSEFEEFRGHGPDGDMMAIEFTDIRGTRWRRNLSGTLTEVIR